MNRREMLRMAAAGLIGCSAFPLGWTRAAEPAKKPKLLYFTRSVGFEHSVVHREAGAPSHSEKILAELGKKVGFEVEATKDGRVFDSSLDGFDAIVFYTCGDLTKVEEKNDPAMSAAGKEKFLTAVAAGKPFIGLHSSCYWGDTPGGKIDPALALLGGQFIVHGEQQDAAMRVVSAKFPGLEKAGASFRFVDEWYAMKDFAKDMHVILLQDTEGMKGDMYARPVFPSTWARMHEKGRVFFTSMGHREDVWTNPIFQSVLLGGIAWALGNAQADIKPNLDTVAPLAERLTR
jgi:type 1 glutamine amidotransferase